ncbi:peroxiredoxin [Sphingomonas sp.]|uniref:peroxiredoxin n=1 Tax=Sphingomonas sp. TaxID=28214 RepID=UPI002EDAB777
MTIGIGDRLPKATLIKVTPEGPDQVDSEAFFAGRKVALFAVPGAFTPTCSQRHLPGFVEKEAELKAKGVDEIACTSVNDAFVLGAWSKASDAGAITMLADGNAEFAEALGLTTDSSRFGMGTRSQRYSMIVDDGVVTALNVEGPGEFKVSSADHLLSTMA